jgi:hypothetical protein
MTEIEQLILVRLEQIERRLDANAKEAREEQAKIWACVSEIKSAVKVLNVKAGVWGAGGGILVAIGGALWLILK